MEHRRLLGFVVPRGEKRRQNEYCDEAKKKMREASVRRMTTKQFFLPDKRSSMITDDESDIIVRRSFESIIALFEFILSLLKFQLNHHSQRDSCKRKYKG